MPRTKKAPTRRNTAKYPALQPKLNLKTRTDLVDYDYIDKLSAKDKRWLNNFTEEYVHANMRHRGEKLHVTPEQKKNCYDMNNSRNRDILTRSKACGKAVGFDDVTEKDSLHNNPEQRFVDNIDKEREDGFLEKEESQKKNQDESN